MTHDRALEREFAERSNERANAMERQEIEAAVRRREWEHATLQLERDGLDWRTWERLAEIEGARIEGRDSEAVGDAVPTGRRGWSRGLTVQQLRALPYPIYLLTEHWQAVRDRALIAAGYRCQRCERGDHLDVHHKSYARLGEEPSEDVWVLCRSCHLAEHRRLESQSQQPDGQEESSVSNSNA